MDFFKPLKVYAQVDGEASPTIPFTPPGEVTPTAVVPTSTEEGPTISISSDKTSLKVGETTKISVVIDTDLQTINAYTVQLLYNPEFLTVIDSDNTTDKVETDFQDTFFDPLINEVSLSQGIIVIQAENPAGSASITDRTIAEFEIKALKAGFAEVAFSEDNSKLVTSTSENILQTSNTLNFNITGGTVEPTISNITTTPNPNVTSLPTSSIALPSETPKTALTDHMSPPMIMALGILLISLGTYIYKIREPRNVKKV